jgi:hypothetical protein
VVVALGVLFAVPEATASEPVSASFITPTKVVPDEFIIGTDVFAADIGDRHVVRGVPLGVGPGTVTFEIERFRVFAADAEIIVHTVDGDHRFPVPKNIYFRGRVANQPGSTVVMSILAGGRVRGLVTAGGRNWVFGGDAINKLLPSRIRIREIEQVVELEHDVQGFVCEADMLQIPPGPKTEYDAPSDRAMFQKAASYTARIAVETDNEFYNKFGNATDATDYVADIIAYGSTIYSAEVNTSWVVQHLSLWAPGNTDPWSQSAPDCGLYEFGRYWNDNRQAISRSTAAFFSGKSTNGGIAWTGVLCYGPFNVDLDPDDGGPYPRACPTLTPEVDNYGGEYAYIGGMDGNFDINNPAAVWDMVAVAHEIGHNFNSPHTHCYAGIGGNADQIDQCYGLESSPYYSCHSGAEILPSGCPGQGNGCGTIMSYCHTMPGGLSNMSLTLGESHPYGVEPGRVPSRMSAHVSVQAASNPGCLDYVPVDDIFSDGFESGESDAWSNTVP